MVSTVEKRRGPATAVAMEPRGAVSCGSLGINDPNTQRPSKQKRTRQHESKVLLLLLLLLRPKLTYTLQKEERTQVRSRSSLEVWNRWIACTKTKLPHLSIQSSMKPWSAIFLILTLLEIHHRSGYIHLCWIMQPYHGQGQQSRSSRHSRDRTRTGSDSTAIRGKPTPQVSLTSFNNHQGGRKCSHPLRTPFLRSARLLQQL